MMNSNSHNRLLASQSSSFRQYAENYDEIIKICEETGRKPAEILRDAIDEWLLMRRATAAGGDASTRMRLGKQTPESIQKQYEALEREWNAQCNATADKIQEIIRKGRQNAQAEPRQD